MSDEDIDSEHDIALTAANLRTHAKWLVHEVEKRWMG